VLILVMVRKTDVNERVEISNTEGKILFLEENLQKFGILVDQNENQEPVSELLALEFNFISLIETSLKLSVFPKILEKLDISDSSVEEEIQLLVLDI